MFKFVPRMIPNKIFVIGCGGTGSRLVPPLVQFLSTITKENNPKGWLSGTTIYLVDSDVVDC
jgi:NADH:ubiquinone oxidoreductase subunit B-like Fe-S oxidoreductase